jgi:hypothetical protein
LAKVRLSTTQCAGSPQDPKSPRAYNGGIMTTDNHSFIEAAGKFAVRAKRSASGLRNRQKQAEKLAKEPNPADRSK